MASLPQTPGGRQTPRTGLPTPKSHIPTPGRPRSVTGGQYDHNQPTNTDPDAMRALSDAIRANNPAQHREQLTPGLPDASGRRSVAGKASLASSTMSRASSSSTSQYAYNPSGASLRPKTPSSATAMTFNQVQTPRQASHARAPSRGGDIFSLSTNVRPTSRLQNHPQTTPKTFELGDYVRIDTLDQEGTIQYIGTITDKPGSFVGIQLAPAYYGMGKNDGSVNGHPYFTCPPLCGIFVREDKISRPPPRPSSAASGRSTPSLTGRSTPSVSGRSVSRVGNATIGFKTPVPPKSKFTEGSRASKYAALTEQIAATGNTPGPRANGTASPPRSPTRSSPTRSFTAAVTPKASGRPAAMGFTGPRSRKSLTSTPKAANRDSRTRSPIQNLPNSALFGSPIRGPNSLSQSRTPTYSQTSSDTLVDDPLTALEGKAEDSLSLEATGRALQERIARLIERDTTTPSPAFSPISHSTSASLVGFESPVASPRRPTSPHRFSSPRRDPFRVGGTSQVQQLVLRIDELEAELERAKTAALNGDHTALDLALGGDSNGRFAQLEARAQAAETETAEMKSKLEAEVGELRLSNDVFKTELEGKIAAATKLESDMSALKKEGDGHENVLKEIKMLLEERTNTVKSLEERLAKTEKQAEEDHVELSAQVEELRLAGQETIALYEERLNNSEASRYHLEDTVKSLEEQIRSQAEPLDPAELTARATMAAQIDNETLKEQVTHLRKRILNLEEQLDEARASAERDEEAAGARLNKFRETETQLRNDIAMLTSEKEEIEKAEAAARSRIDELTNALKESDTALEDARAEIETLRVEVSSLEAAALNAQTSDETVADVEKLKADLAESRASTTKYEEQISDLTAQHDALKSQVDTLVTERSQLEERHQAAVDVSSAHQDRVSELTRLLEDRKAEVDALHASSRASSPRDSKRDDLRDQVTGLKHVVAELTKENATLVSANKVLDSDNQQLLSETLGLRDSLKKLEDAFEQSIIHEQSALDAESPGSPSAQDADELRQAAKETQRRHEYEIEQVRRKASETEANMKRDIRKLEKEIAEMSDLVEAKIFREDELEREVERLTRKISRRASKSGDNSKSRSSSHRTPKSSTQSQLSDTTSEASAPNDVDASGLTCELCHQPGHDLVTCPVVFEDGDVTTTVKPNGLPVADTEQDLWCVDCESKGHDTANCPYSQDVF